MGIALHASGSKTLVYGTATMTIASPGVVTYNAHGLSAGDKVRFTTTGALPTGIVAGTDYYVLASGLTANTFQLSVTDGGAAINTTGSQSGTHTASAEIFLTNPNLAASYLFNANLSSMVSSPLDVIQLRVYTMVVAAGAIDVLQMQEFSGAMSSDDRVQASIPWTSALTDTNANRCSIAQRGGTARTIPWNVTRIT